MIEALIFDVFGTCVNWRTSVAREVAKALPDTDPVAFADAWRDEYQPAMERIRAGNRGYVPLDDLHLENLHIVLERFGLSCGDPHQLNRAWEKLDPWPDVVPGLTALKDRFIIAPCSNGSFALMTRLARYGGLPWDCKPRNYANSLVGLFSVLLPILIYGPIELMAQKWLKV